MAGRNDVNSSTINSRPRCPKCNSRSTLGYLNGRNGKINYFCSKCSIEATFNVAGETISFTELSADGTAKETQVRKTRYKMKKDKK